MVAVVVLARHAFGHLELDEQLARKHDVSLRAAFGLSDDCRLSAKSQNLVVFIGNSLVFGFSHQRFHRIVPAGVPHTLLHL